MYTGISNNISYYTPVKFIITYNDAEYNLLRRKNDFISNETFILAHTHTNTYSYNRMCIYV